jgi:gamma-D-glutamyl-L-lysine dipeptidyl-peptidase
MNFYTALTRIYGCTLLGASLIAAPLQQGDLVVPAVPIVTAYAQPQEFTGAIQYPVVSAMGVGNHTQFMYGEQLVVAELGQHGWVSVTSSEQPIYLAKNFLQSPTWIDCDGWVKQDQLQKVQNYQPSTVVVSAAWACAYAAPAGDAKQVMKFSFGTTLHATQPANNNAWVQIVLADGATAFVRATDVSLLADLATKQEDQLRALVCSNAQALLGMPYVWGGRSAHDQDNKTVLSGCDCSAFINLAYRTIGLIVARNSVSQHKQAKQIAFKDLKPGDMIFFSYYANFVSRVRHVMLYLGDNTCIDVTGAGDKTGIFVVLSRDKIGHNLTELEGTSLVYEKNGQAVTVTAGTFFDETCKLGRLGA